MRGVVIFFHYDYTKHYIYLILDLSYKNPHAASIKENTEEERRFMHVGITISKQRNWIHVCVIGI